MRAVGHLTYSSPTGSAEHFIPWANPLSPRSSSNFETCGFETLCLKHGSEGTLLGSTLTLDLTKSVVANVDGAIYYLQGCTQHTMPPTTTVPKFFVR